MPNPIVHFEIGCQNRASTQQFYTAMFDWTTSEMGPATMIHTGDKVGGHISALGHEPHRYTIFYVLVEDVASAVQKAESLGGKMLVPPVKIPTGTFAWIADPEGNTVGLFQGAIA